MRFNNSTQKPRSQLPRLLRFWLGQPAGQTRSLAPRVWGQSVGPNSSIPIAGAAHPLLTVYDHFHSVLLKTFLLHSQGLRVVESPGLGTREPGIVNRFLFFVKLRLHRKKGNLLQTHAPDLPRKNHPVGGGRFPEMLQEARWIFILRFALLWFCTQDALPSFFSFQIQVFKAPHFGPTLWPHTLPPPPRIDFRRRASFWQVFTSEALKLAVARTGGDPARRGRADSRGREEETEGGGGGGGRREVGCNLRKTSSWLDFFSCVMWQKT